MREGWAAAEGGRNNEHTAVVSLSNLDKRTHYVYRPISPHFKAQPTLPPHP